jgi:ParB family transcriptional regulator, chromosome partitioning protein
MSKQVLGRGLASLIPRLPAPVPPAPVGRQDDGTSNEIIAQIDLDRIEQNPYQPRADFDPVALDELRQSILEKGIIQPITVRRLERGYQLVSGERRVRAAREAGLRQIPAYIIKVQSNEEMLELALIENLQREHLNPIEVAISYKRLIDECRLTQDEVSQRIGKDRTTVTNFLRLLRLPESIQMAVRRGELSGGHARALAGIEDAVLQQKVFKKAVSRGLSVREVERLAQQKGKRKAVPASVRGGEAGATLSNLEDRLRQFLGTKVQIRPIHEGKGELLIEYYSSEDLERILEIFERLEDHRQS